MNTWVYTYIHDEADVNAAVERRWYAAAATAATTTTGFGHQLLSSTQLSHPFTAVGAAQGLQNGVYLQFTT